MHQRKRQANTAQGQRTLGGQHHICAPCRTRGRTRLACIRQGTLHMCLPCTLAHLSKQTGRKTSTTKSR